MTHQTAAAHERVFVMIEDTVQKDTGKKLLWRHIDVESVDNHIGILHWAADQHGGQAKGKISCKVRYNQDLPLHDVSGLGLHLQKRAAEFPKKMDLHEPHQMLAKLTPYDHLHRIFRLCTVHVFRNIKTCKVSDDVRNLMRSLVCIRHKNWEETISQIETLGRKAAIGDNIKPAFHSTNRPN